MKLIKLSEEHYIIVDDSEIKEGDWMIRNGEQPTLVTPNFWWDFGVPYKKITHSTIPKGQMLMEGLKRLSIQEVKELIGEVDVEKRFQDILNTETPQEMDIMLLEATKHGFKYGYKQVIEDNKEKKYTEEQVKEACRLFAVGKTLDSCIKSLQPKTEWEVEFIDVKLKLK